MLGTSVYLIVFRIVHIGAGVMWAGSVFIFVVFVQPSAAAIGPAAGPFLQELLGKRKVLDRILGVAGATIAGGLFLYWHDSAGFAGLGDFLGSAFGLALTVGAISAIVAFLIGLLGTRPAITRTMALGRRVAEAAGTPPPEVAAELRTIQARAKILARANLAFVMLSVLAMSTARYW